MSTTTGVLCMHHGCQWHVACLMSFVYIYIFSTGDRTLMWMLTCAGSTTVSNSVQDEMKCYCFHVVYKSPRQSTCGNLAALTRTTKTAQQLLSLHSKTSNVSALTHHISPQSCNNQQERCWWWSNHSCMKRHSFVQLQMSTGHCLYGRTSSNILPSSGKYILVMQCSMIDLCTC